MKSPKKALTSPAMMASTETEHSCEGNTMSTSAEAGPRRSRQRLFASTVALSIAALVLAGCGEDPREESTPATNTDPSGAADQGNAPEGIAGDAGDAQAVGIADIEDEIWETSLDQENATFTVTGGLQSGQELLGYNPEVFQAETGTESENDESENDETEDDETEDAESEDADAEDESSETEVSNETFELLVTGQIEGDSATELNYSPDYSVMTFGDETYQSVDGFVFDYEAQIPPEVEPEVDAAELESALLAEGDWVDVSMSEPPVPRTPAELIESLRERLDETVDGASLADLELESTVDTRDGENVWVYFNDQVEIAVLADESNPLLVGLLLRGEDELDVAVTDWNESTTPESPGDETVIADDQLQEILAGFI